MQVTATAFRRNIYRLLDRVVTTGEPLEITHRGQLLKVVRERPPGKLARLRRRPDAIVGDPEDLVRLDWAGAWR